MGPVFAKIIETEKEALTKEFRELTKSPGSPTATESEDPASRQERSAPQSSNEPVDGVTCKSRFERFDEVFRTLLVIASVLTAFHLATTEKTSLSLIFQMTLMLLMAMVIWSVAVLWGGHPMAHAARLASLELLSLHLVTILSVLFLMIPPAVAGRVSFSAGLLAAMTVDSIAVFGLGMIYLRLERRQIGVASLVTGFAIVLWICMVTFLYP